MNPGKLSTLLNVQAKTGATVENDGTHSPDWATVATRWARIEPLDDRELIQDDREQGRTRYRVTIRFYDGLTSAYRFTTASRTFWIEKVIHQDERRAVQVCQCMEKT